MYGIYSIAFLEFGRAYANFLDRARNVFTDDDAVGVSIDDDAPRLDSPIGWSKSGGLDFDQDLPSAGPGCGYRSDDEEGLLLGEEERFMLGHDERTILA